MNMQSEWMPPVDAKSAAELLMQDQQLCETPLHLTIGDCGLTVRSNSQPLLNRLKNYFRQLSQKPARASMELVAIESKVLDSGLPFIDWQREPKKNGRKDAYVELPDGRIILKVHTGMLFLQSEAWRIAAGPCLEYDNQLINFINSQVMNWLQQRDWLICHAAGVILKGHALGIAGFSGRGKSTLMLHLMEIPNSCFLTNDRLFLRRQGVEVEAVGIPKLPRVNPGTVVNNPRLESLIGEQRRAELLNLPKEALWNLQEKFDIDIEQIYGRHHIDTSTPRPLSGLLILNWSQTDDAPVNLHKVDIEQRGELLSAVMKSPGPFFQDKLGIFLEDDDQLKTASYRDLLTGVNIYEVTGRMDFSELMVLCLEKWGS